MGMPVAQQPKRGYFATGMWAVQIKAMSSGKGTRERLGHGHMGRGGFDL